MATKNQRRVPEGRRRSFFRRPAVLAALPLAALTLLVAIGPRRDGSRHSETTVTDERQESTPPRSDVPPPLPRLILKETPPWKSTRNNTPAATPGLTPAWMVSPPPPPTLAPPPPVEPPNPIVHRPDNLGGVNGDRPPRPETLVP